MNPLALSDAEYRAIFERITQLTLEYLATLNRRPSFPGTSGSESDALFRKPLPEDGIGPKALDDLARVIDGARAGGPRFFGYVLGLRMPALSRRRCRAACVLTHRRLRQVVTDESIELSRRFRALKVWLSLRYHGVTAFREAIRNDLTLAQHLAELISNEPELELLAPVTLSAVCFRYRAEVDSDELNEKILQRVVRRGKVFLSNAGIHGRFAPRACVVNHRTTTADVEQVVSEVIAVGRELTARSES